MCKRKGFAPGANFSSATPRSRGDSVRLRSKQAGGDPSAGACMDRMAAAAGAVPASMSNMKRILERGKWPQARKKSAPCADAR